VPTLSLPYGDIFQLPAIRGRLREKRKDHLWVPSESATETVAGATFIDNAHYLSAAQLRSDVTDTVQNWKLLVYVVLHEASVCERWVIADRSCGGPQTWTGDRRRPHEFRATATWQPQ